MLSTLLLAGSLWAASQDVRQLPPEAFYPVLITPVEDFGDALAIDLVFNGVGTGSDLVSTDWAIENGCVEGNPLIPRVEGRIGAKIGAGAIRGALAYYLRRSGHKTMANILRYAGAVVDVGLVFNNVACGLRNRK